MELFYEIQEMFAQLLEKKVVTWKLSGLNAILIFISGSAEI